MMYEDPWVERIDLSVDHYDLNKFESRTDNYNLILSKFLKIITSIALQ